MFDDFCKFTQIFTKMDGGLGAITFLWLFCYRSINRPAEKVQVAALMAAVLDVTFWPFWLWCCGNGSSRSWRGWNVHCFYADSMNRWPHPNGNIGSGNLPRIDLNSFLDVKNSGCQRQKWDFTVYWNWPDYLCCLLYLLRLQHKQTRSSSICWGKGTNAWRNSLRSEISVTRTWCIQKLRPWFPDCFPVSTTRNNESIKNQSINLNFVASKIGSWIILSSGREVFPSHGGFLDVAVYNATGLSQTKGVRRRLKRQKWKLFHVSKQQQEIWKPKSEKIQWMKTLTLLVLEPISLIMAGYTVTPLQLPSQNALFSPPFP